MHCGKSTRNCFAALLMLVLSSWQAQAVQILDQEFDAIGGRGSPAVNSGQSLAQTFTVGVEGSLSQLDLQLSKLPLASGYFTLNILQTFNGAPVSTESLFVGSYQKSDLPDYDNDGPNEYVYTEFDISSGSIDVAVGDVLAIALSTTTGSAISEWLAWQGNFTTGYAGGGMYYTRGDLSDPWQQDPFYRWDVGFRTYVTPSVEMSEPPPVALLVAALAGLVAVRQRKAATQ